MKVLFIEENIIPLDKVEAIRADETKLKIYIDMPGNFSLCLVQSGDDVLNECLAELRTFFTNDKGELTLVPESSKWIGG